MGLSTDVLNAIWSRLQADSAMSALLKGGTLFRFNGQGVLTRLEILPAVCPVFAMAPAAGLHHWPPAKRKRGPAAVLERRTAFLIEMATAGEDSRDIVDLAEGFEDFMTRQFEADNFGLGATLRRGGVLEPVLRAEARPAEAHRAVAVHGDDGLQVPHFLGEKDAPQRRRVRGEEKGGCSFNYEEFRRSRCPLRLCGDLGRRLLDGAGRRSRRRSSRRTRPRPRRSRTCRRRSSRSRSRTRRSSTRSRNPRRTPTSSATR